MEVIPCQSSCRKSRYSVPFRELHDANLNKIQLDWKISYALAINKKETPVLKYLQYLSIEKPIKTMIHLN